MTNGEKFKDSNERNAAFNSWCDSHNRVPNQVLAFQWLDMEFEEEPMACLFCHNPMRIGQKPDFSNPDARISYLYCPKCGAESPHCENVEDVIPRYNERLKELYIGHSAMFSDLRYVCHTLCPDNCGYEEKCENCNCRKLLLEKMSLKRRIHDFRRTIEKRAKEKEENERICSTCKHYETVHGAKTVGIRCKVNCELLAKHCPKWERKVAE